ncbi:GNAT family N-acetyltransferase [Sphingorhabdus sp. M41]|uniref:GNAT family N-acetyltransferase n=1 Tax=Sphingorhabdus sp. M41 TaxID=1806885 RepID=UPI00078DDAC9|nr:GNAT family N-acetyltransferase [Sphingorhabdus sp. M41]AMO70771.1 hypothetical protein AZE99_01885 [Sphingorhabdus sp. M41]
MIRLRPACPQDVEALAKLGKATFTSAFGNLYSSNDLASFLEQTHSEARITANIADADTIYRLAEDEASGALVGYCKISTKIGLDYDPGKASAIELSQLYLDNSQFGTGLAGQFMDWVISQARERHCGEIILSVYAENFRAQSFYHRYGFEHIADTIFMVGDHCDPELLYRLILRD